MISTNRHIRRILSVLLFLALGNQHSVAQSRYGPNDTLLVPYVVYEGDTLTYREMEMVFVFGKMSEAQKEAYRKWTRLRNAVYVTYPYARIAGNTINDITKVTDKMDSKKDRKTYIKTREKELKKEFSDPLSNLSVYQGKILMKLINRQTGNNCYEILKEYKGGLNARFYQTIAFFVGGNLKQDWDLKENRMDRDIENIVKEIDGAWYQNPYRR